MELNILSKSNEFPWVLYSDKIYRTKFPSILTMNYIIDEMTNIIHDYVNRYGEDKKIRVLIDASNSIECPEALLLAMNHAIQEQPNSKMAIWNRSTEFKTIENKYYIDHNHAVNNQSFDDEHEAINWLNT